MARILVQTAAFDVGTELDRLAAACPAAGAVASFVGYVRNHNAGQGVTALELEHYPGMTEKALAAIAAEAATRWPVLDLTIIHRVGLLQLQEAIVLVAVASAHRHAAFEACSFVMDVLKSRAPFWKKEYGSNGAQWVDARESDAAALERWYGTVAHQTPAGQR